MRRTLTFCLAIVLGLAAVLLTAPWGGVEGAASKFYGAGEDAAMGAAAYNHTPVHRTGGEKPERKGSFLGSCVWRFFSSILVPVLLSTVITSYLHNTPAMNLQLSTRDLSTQLASVLRLEEGTIVSVVFTRSINVPWSIEYFFIKAYIATGRDLAKLTIKEIVLDYQQSRSLIDMMKASRTAEWQPPHLLWEFVNFLSNEAIMSSLKAVDAIMRYSNGHFTITQVHKGVEKRKHIKNAANPNVQAKGEEKSKGKPVVNQPAEEEEDQEDEFHRVEYNDEM